MKQDEIIKGKNADRENGYPLRSEIIGHKRSYREAGKNDTGD